MRKLVAAFPNFSTQGLDQECEDTMNGWFDVTDYGAVGDGSTDDTTAIGDALSAAIAAKGTLYFPPGTYLFGTNTPGEYGNLYTSSYRVSIVGSGMGSTILKNKSTTAACVFIAGAYDSIENLTIDNNGSTGTALWVGGEYMVVRNIEIINQAGDHFAVKIDGPTLSVFENILISGCTNGMRIGEDNPTNYVNLRQVTIADCSGAYGLRMYECSNVKFFGLYVEVGPTNSILIENCEQLDFFSLGSELAGDVTLTGSSYFTIDGSESVSFFGARINHEGGTNDRTLFRITDSESINFSGIYLRSAGTDMRCFYTAFDPSSLNFTNVLTYFDHAFNGIYNYDAVDQQTVVNWFAHDGTVEATHSFHSGGPWMGLNVGGSITNNSAAMTNAPVLATGAAKTVDDVIAALQALRLVKQS